MVRETVVVAVMSLSSPGAAVSVSRGLCCGSVSLGELGSNEVKLWGCMAQVMEMDCKPFGKAGCYFFHFPGQQYWDWVIQEA